MSVIGKGIVMSQFVIESDGQNEDACGALAEMKITLTMALALQGRLARLGYGDDARGMLDTISTLRAEHDRVNDAILDWESRDGESDTRSRNWHHGRLGVEIGR